MGKLIRLELYNFKSYKGHHTLLFGDSYFTSIIGPNGSGKSNSMDAVSFVLGIKSTHLRSTHLRDLVYRGRVLRHSKINADGTATDAPANGEDTGQANGDRSDEEANTQSSTPQSDPQTAWVMAVFEDDAGDEQQWKRSITNQGQSEYRINNRVVGAKEYNDALENENILIKARNFLVFQGDVEAIASQSPKDLTRLIEQISGSLEYKADYDRLKVEADKATDDQAFKLNQRRAINSEIKQYQEQKKEVDNYNTRVDEKDRAIVTHVLWRLYHFQRTMEESGAEIQKHQEELKEFRRNVETYESRLDDAKKDHAKVGRDVGRVERNIKRKEKEIEEKKNGLVPVDEKIAISTRNLRKYESRIAEVSKERDSQSQNVDRLKKDLDVVQRAQRRWEEEWRAAQQNEGRQLTEADLQEYSRLRGDVSRRTAADQIRVDEITRQLRTDEETVNSLQSKVDSYEAQVQKLQEEINDLTERRDAIDTSIQQIVKEIDSKKREIAVITSERLRTAQMHTELDEKLQEVLRKLIEADTGRRESEKDLRAREMVAAMRNLFPGVRGRVHELCKPKQKKYDTAVSTVLGRHFNSIVVDTEKIAKECIQYLRDKRAGQATFIPLDTIQHKAPNPNLKGMHRGMRLAIDTIDYDHSLERAMYYACGDAIVCDDLAIAKYLCYERGVEAKAVTLDGTVIHKAGLITGGRGPNDRNQRRWEDTEVENLKRLRDKLLADLQALPRSHRRETEEETLQGELAALEQRLSYARDELAALDRNLESKQRELSFAISQLDEARPKLEEQSSGLDTLRASLTRYTSAISGVQDTVFADFCARLGYANIRAYEAQQGSLQQEAARKKLEFTTQRSKLENQLSFETQRLQATNDRIANLQQQSQRDQEMLSTLEAEKESLGAELDVLNAEREELDSQLKRLKTSYGERAERVTEARREVQKRSKNVESTLKSVSALEAQVQRAAAERYALLRRCKIDEVKIPLAQGSRKLDSLPLDDVLGTGDGADAMDVDGEEDSPRAPEVQDYGIEIDFDALDDDLKDDDSETLGAQLLETINSLNSELEKMAPNMRAVERLENVSEKLKSTDREFDASRRSMKRAKDAFEDVREKRKERFEKAYNHIHDRIGQVYKDLTRSASFPLGGQAYLDVEETEEPYLSGVKYHAMPPLKRFRDMEHLSGGEKTMAALALLFAIHSYAPSPFFVLDEVDAALDNANVARIAAYIREHAGPGMQFIVISLKTGLFQNSETLVGVMRDQGINSSRALTLDLRKYQPA
ncbi:Structural maintenance of chromosomes protein 1 [Elasticomyces elasticus]|nr:Structural maintenance of chromosomes protein 1 [Elasticomyces elasticus]